MDRTVFLGDYILEKEDHSGKTYFYFAGAEKLNEDQWKVNFSLKSHYLNDTGSMVGIGSNMYLISSKDEIFRMGAGCTSEFIKGQGMFREKIEHKNVKEIKLSNIEKDLLTIEYL